MTMTSRVSRDIQKGRKGEAFGSLAPPAVDVALSEDTSATRLLETEWWRECEYAAPATAVQRCCTFFICACLSSLAGMAAMRATSAMKATTASMGRVRSRAPIDTRTMATTSEPNVIATNSMVAHSSFEP